MIEKKSRKGSSMKTVRTIVIVAVLIVLVLLISFPIFLQFQRRASRKRLFDSVSLLQKAFVIAKFDEEKQRLDKVVDELIAAETLLREYRLDELDALSGRVMKAAEAVMEARKSAVLSGAHIAHVVGDIEYLEGGTRSTQAETNMKIRSGDVLTLRKGSGCEIIFIDGSTMTLRYPSVLVFNRIHEDKGALSLGVTMTLQRGGLRFSASKITDYNPSFSISAGTAEVLYTLNAAGEVARNRSILQTTVSCTEGNITVNAGSQQLQLKPQMQARLSDNSDAVEQFSLPPMPMADAPANFKSIDAGRTREVEFKWTSVYNAAGYYFELADNTVFANPMVVRKGYSGTTLALPVPASGTYYWQVAALNEANERGRFSSIREFKVVEDRDAQVLVDQVPPPLSLEQVRVFGTTAIVQGKTESGAMVTVNNKVIEVKADGSFSAIITLYQSGRNKIEVIARDSADNETVEERWVSIKIY